MMPRLLLRPTIGPTGIMKPFLTPQVVLLSLPPLMMALETMMSLEAVVDAYDALKVIPKTPHILVSSLVFQNRHLGTQDVFFLTLTASLHPLAVLKLLSRQPLLCAAR